MQVLHVQDYFFAHVHEVVYRIPANSFFQVSYKRCEKLFKQVVAAANMQVDNTVLDLYCGAGALACTESQLGPPALSALLQVRLS